MRAARSSRVEIYVGDVATTTIRCRPPLYGNEKQTIERGWLDSYQSYKPSRNRYGVSNIVSDYGSMLRRRLISY